MAQRFYEPEEGTEQENRIAAGELYVPAWGADSVSTLTARTATPRDNDIICSNGMMANNGYERHPGNRRLKQIIEGKVGQEQCIETLVGSVLEEIKREIENLDEGEPPSFLIQNSNGEWRKASNVEIKNEISGEWHHAIDRRGIENGVGRSVDVVPPPVEKQFNGENNGALNGSNNRRDLQPVKNVAIVVLALLVVILGSMLRRVDREEGKETTSPDPIPTATVELDAGSETLSTTLRREYLKCGVMSQLGFAREDRQGIWEGFEVDLCRAVAAGIFGKDKFFDRLSEPVEFVPLEAGERFPSLNNKTIDLLFAKTSQTIERGLYEVRSDVKGSEIFLGSWLVAHIVRSIFAYVPSPGEDQNRIHFLNTVSSNRAYSSWSA